LYQKAETNSVIEAVPAVTTQANPNAVT